MKATQNLLIAVVLALALGGLGIAMDDGPDELTVAQQVADDHADAIKTAVLEAAK